MTSSSQLPYRALIVDDESSNRELFRYALQFADFETYEASNGAEALALLETTDFNVLILDLQMPVMDGVTVLRRLRPKTNDPDMMVLVATANPHMISDDIEDEADYIMYKPVDINKVTQLVARLKPTQVG